jgi:Capsular polysaccharide biosynthesis protein
MDERRVNNQQEDVDIDLWEIVQLLWAKLGIILICCVACATVAFAITSIFITPKYESVTKMYVLTKQDEGNLTQGDMQTSTYVTKDYAELIKSRTVTEAVVTELGLSITGVELLDKIDVLIPTDTRIVGIRVRDEDPYKAAEIANAMREASGKHIQEVMEIEAVNMVEDANVPRRPTSPNVLRNALIGGAVGLFLSVAIIIIMNLLNDDIRTEEDIKKYLDISVLGTIPLEDGSKKKTRKRMSLRRRG